MPLAEDESTTDIDSAGVYYMSVEEFEARSGGAGEHAERLVPREAGSGEAIREPTWLERIIRRLRRSLKRTAA